MPLNLKLVFGIQKNNISAMSKFKQHLFCLLTLAAAVFAAPSLAGNTAPWVRAYIEGEEITGSTLESRYTAPEDESPSPVIRWEKSDSRNGKPVLVQQGADAESYTLTDKDAGKYFRIIVGAGTKDAIESAWIGPVMTEEQAEGITNRFDSGKSYHENVADLQNELKEKLKDSVYFTVETGPLHASPYAMVRNKRTAIPENLRPFRENGKIYLNQPFIQAVFKKELPDEIMEEAGGQKAYELGNAARALKLNLWLGDENRAPVDNFRMQPMAEGLVILTPEKNVFSPVKDRDLINEAVNQLFDFKAGEEQLQWFRNAKFGMFLHWNPSSLLEREISWERNAVRPRDSASGHKNIVDFEYDSAYRNFNPRQYDPRKWMSIAKKSGMKYAVLTTKHHDGFSNFPSGYDTYTIAATPYKKDIVGQFAAAARAAGLKVGFYYSGRDWFNPYYLTNQHYRYLEYYFGQLSELLTRYGQVDVIWFDSLGNSSLNQWDPRTMVRRIKQYQPDILINNRMNGTRGGGNKGDLLEELKGDFLTPECKLGPFNSKTPWESCMTVANIPGTHWTGNWSYTSKAKTVPLEKSIKFLINNTVKDGNLLYNIGPTPLGAFDPEQANIFLSMGKWIAPYREAIYNTRGGPYIEQPWGGSCYKTSANGKKTVYLHVSPLIAQNGKALKGSEPLFIKDLGEKFTKATVIVNGNGNGKAAKLEKEDGQYKITLPAGVTWDSLDTVIKLQ